MSTFVVFGATGTIGEQVVRQMIDRNYDVVAVGRSPERLESLAAKERCECVKVDDCSFDEIARAFNSASCDREQIDGVACLIGSLLLRPAHRTSAEDFDSIINANLGAAFAVVRSAAPFLRSSGGAITLMASAAASVGLPNHEAIAAAKAGVCGLVRSAAATNAKYNVRVNAISPGLVRTRLTKRIWTNESALATSAAMHPIGRIATPGESLRQSCGALIQRIHG